MKNTFFLSTSLDKSLCNSYVFVTKHSDSYYAHISKMYVIDYVNKVKYKLLIYSSTWVLIWIFCCKNVIEEKEVILKTYDFYCYINYLIYKNDTFNLYAVIKLFKDVICAGDGGRVRGRGWDESLRVCVWNNDLPQRMCAIAHYLNRKYLRREGYIYNSLRKLSAYGDAFTNGQNCTILTDGAI